MAGARSIGIIQQQVISMEVWQQNSFGLVCVAGLPAALAM